MFVGAVLATAYALSHKSPGLHPKVPHPPLPFADAVLVSVVPLLLLAATMLVRALGVPWGTSLFCGFIAGGTGAALLLLQSRSHPTLIVASGIVVPCLALICAAMTQQPTRWEIIATAVLFGVVLGVAVWQVGNPDSELLIPVAWLLLPLVAALFPPRTQAPQLR